MDESPETQAEIRSVPPHPEMLPTPAGPYDVFQLLRRAFNQLDSIADRIAHAAGLR